MTRRRLALTAALTAASLIAAACGGSSSGTGTTSGSCSKTFKVGLVTDVGKLSDKSFNANAWQGVQDAQNDKSLCVSARYIESNQPTDYDKNIAQFADGKYDMIVTVGFLLADDTLKGAQKYPNVKFAIVDNAYDKPAANLVGLTFQEDQAGYLAGFVAGAFTKTNVIGGVYGLDIPPVKKYRVGFENGAKAANPSIKTLGVYQPAGPKAFNDPDWGKQQAQAMFGQNADIVFGAGGTTGNGALLAAVQGNKTCVGVDVDQYVSYPEVNKCLLTSAEKHIALAVKSAITNMVKNTWPSSGVLNFNAANNGVGIAPFHDYDSRVSAEIKAKVADIQKKLADGTLKTGYTG